MKRKNIFILSFLTPPLLIYVVFFIYPFLQSFRISFYKWSGYTKDMEFVGLANFKKMIKDSAVFSAFKNDLFFIVVASVLIFIIAMFFAVTFTSKNYPEIGFYRVLYFFPNMLSIVIVALIWMFIYNPSFGLINGILQFFGYEGESIALLGSTKTVLAALVAPQVWMQLGFYMVLFIAAINTVPKSLYEAADIDGASNFRKFSSITLPSIWYTIQISIIFFIINTVNNAFALISVTTKGGPYGSSEVLTTYYYKQAFVNSDFGYGTAIALSLFIFMFIVSLIVMKVTEQRS